MKLWMRKIFVVLFIIVIFGFVFFLVVFMVDKFFGQLSSFEQNDYIVFYDEYDLYDDDELEDR